ncbi:helix-turn-helix domain-containing protein [Streptomyces sp. SID4919]|uniref:helix-turn-helix domain-containing protein n=1 Tax=unclassified Streptomyces TaxID=2593676 RepID=UPI000823B95E|nr:MULTISPECIES: helix-turn-helix transcriptional regulator [unclassified Streptomyces]MYY08838.1 helix-turn-helix domain-containing protein [Streptomyces sp. SID4919]SCK25705.1 Helix-turn-helix domain-containing protein [Streptomyces sp. AmelKG-E11A]
MATGPTGSTVPRRRLGRNLRTLRARAGLSVRAAANALEWSETKIWRIETGQSPLRALDVEAMCRVYGGEPDLTTALMGLARETKARGWWHSYGDVVPVGFDIYAGLEETASDIATYESDLVPGLLQTDGYVRAVMCTHRPGISADDLAGRVQLRMERQRILTRAADPTVLRVALSEAAVRRQVGGAEVMAGQLAHLVYVSGLPNVSVRLVPFSAGMHSGVIAGPFVVLRFPARGDGAQTEPPTVYADGYTGGLYLDKLAEVEQYENAFAGIWSAALDEEATRRLLADVAGSYRS